MQDKNGKKSENENNEQNNEQNIKESNKESNNQTSDVTKQETNSNKNSSNETNSDKDTFQDYVAEFKKIVWPTKQEIFKKTTTVMSMSIFVGAIVFCMDSALNTAYTASLRAVRDDIPDYSTELLYDDAEIQQMLEGITIEGEDGSVLDSSDYVINEDGSISIGGTQTEGTTEDGSTEATTEEDSTSDDRVQLDGVSIGSSGVEAEITMTDGSSSDTEYESSVDGMDLPEGAIPVDDGFIFDLNQYDFESDPLNLGDSVNLDDVQSDLSSDDIEVTIEDVEIEE